MTRPASTACGIPPRSGARRSIVSSVAPAVTSVASCVRAPARRFTAVCDVPPPDGIAPKRPPPALARPVARSSRFGRSGGSSDRAKARAAAIVSVKLMSAMPRAAGHSRATSGSSGSVTDGRPRGIAPMASTPRACRPEQAHRRDAGGDDDERRRRFRQEVLEGDQEPDRGDPDRERRPRGLGKVLHDRSQIAEEAGLGKVDAEELRDLVEHDDEPDPRLEADQDRLGDEVRDEAEPQQGRHEEDAARR